jgi:hypothetical protein
VPSLSHAMEMTSGELLRVKASSLYIPPTSIPSTEAAAALFPWEEHRERENARQQFPPSMESCGSPRPGPYTHLPNQAVVRQPAHYTLPNATMVALAPIEPSVRNTCFCLS